MKILSVNAGSSSLKFTLFEMPAGVELIGGYFEKIGLEDSFYSIKINGEKVKKQTLIKDRKEAVNALINELLENNIISSLDEIEGVGHRTVHGGDKFSGSVIITDEVIKTMEECIPLAPLHNPANLTGIKAFMDSINVPNVGVFDTAFHQTMPQVNYLYPVPYEFYENYKIRKYGFHGTSYKYITRTMKEKLGKEDVNLIIAHIGSGGSLCCVKDGKSYDTTMGFSPNAGIMMGTRSGDIDYTLIDYYMNQTGASLKDVDTILNKKSGLAGVSEGLSDARDVEDAIKAGNARAKLAYDMYIDKIAGYIAKYYVELEGNVDAIVLTAGVGENGADFRNMLMNKLACLGIKIDEEVNGKIAGFKDIHEGIISTNDSSIRVEVLPTNEELMIAIDTYELIGE